MSLTPQQEFAQYARRREALRLYLKGRTQYEIAEKLGVDQATVSRDLRVMRKKWEKTDERRGRQAAGAEEARLRLIEDELWRKWDNPEPDRIAQIVKNSKTGDEKHTTRIVEKGGGDPRLLTLAYKCALARRNAPANRTASTRTVSSNGTVTTVVRQGIPNVPSFPWESKPNDEFDEAARSFLAGEEADDQLAPEEADDDLTEEELDYIWAPDDHAAEEMLAALRSEAMGGVTADREAVERGQQAGDRSREDSVPDPRRQIPVDQSPVHQSPPPKSPTPDSNPARSVERIVSDADRTFRELNQNMHQVEREFFGENTRKDAAHRDATLSPASTTHSGERKGFTKPASPNGFTPPDAIAPCLTRREPGT